MTYSKEKHDFGILRTSGSSVGFMVNRTSDNLIAQSAYVVDDEPYLVEQISTTGASYSSLNPIKEIALVEDDFSGGGGLEFQDNSRVHMYHESFGIDLRIKGSVIPGQAATTYVTSQVTAPSTTLALVDGGLENWDDATHLTSWTEDAAHTDIEATIIEEGTYSAKIADTDDTGRTITQTIGTFHNDWRGKYVGASARCKLSHATNIDAKITINGTTSISTNTTDWQTISVVHKVGSAATEIVLSIEALAGIGQSENIYVDDVKFFSASRGITKNFTRYNNKLYYSNGSYLFCSDSTSVPIEALPSVISSLAVFGDYLFIGFEDATCPYAYCDTDNVITFSTLTDCYARYFEAIGETLWKAVLPNQISSNTSGINGGAAWAAATYVDSTTTNITGLLAFNGALNIFKEDREYYLDSTGAIQIWEDVTTTIQSSTGGSINYLWEGRTYAVYGGNNLLENDSGNFSWVSPIKFFANSPNFCGTINGITGDSQYLYISVNYLSHTTILAGRYETNENGTQWIWHPFAYLGGDYYELSCQNIVDERIWLGFLNGIYYLDNDITVTGFPDKTFTASGYFTTPWYHLNFKGDNKAFLKLTLNMESTATSRYFIAYYKKWGDSDWTTIGNFQTSPSTTAYIPAIVGTGVKCISTHIKFKIEFFHTPGIAVVIAKLHSLDLRAVLYPHTRTIHKIVLRVGDNILDKQGVYLQENAATLDTVIEEARAQQYPFTFYDIWGNTKTGKLLPATPFKQLVSTESQRGFDTLYYLTLEEITIS